MKIKKIKAINGYKSYDSFEWHKFCKNKNGQELIFQNFTTVFGENGSGKSSICDVLKNVSKNQDFQTDRPTSLEIEINDGTSDRTYKYENGSWTSQVSKNSFLFFDVDFINANVHTHGVRSSNLQQGAHTQKAGKLIIDLDEHANSLKLVIKEKKDELDALQNASIDVLAKQFSDKDKELFQTYKDTEDQAKQTKLSEGQEALKKLETELTTLQKLNEKYSEINRLPEVGQVVFLAHFPKKKLLRSFSHVK